MRRKSTPNLYVKFNPSNGRSSVPLCHPQPQIHRTWQALPGIGIAGLLDFSRCSTRIRAEIFSSTFLPERVAVWTTATLTNWSLYPLCVYGSITPAYSVHRGAVGLGARLESE